MGIWTSKDMERQDGRRVFVTGGLSGIGFQTARVIAEKGADVTVIGRDAAKGRQALAELGGIVPSGSFSFEQADLGDLESISDFAGRVLQKGQRIDLLLNVAGVMAVPERRLTTDGFEMHMGTNHLGHFALTGRLLPLLKNARVVQVTAQVARWAKLDLDDLQSSKSYGPMSAYAKSKLANILFAVELNKRSEGLGPSAVAVDPGTANTNLQRNSSGLMRSLGTKLVNIIGYPLDRVADPVVFGAVFPPPDDHSYVKPEKFIQKSGPPAYTEVPKPALDEELRKRLWEMSEELTGVHY
jgi:NAD(P)-dependent dehydrogenase (short-subunit alcohol dehydrogenase family)